MRANEQIALVETYFAAVDAEELELDVGPVVAVPVDLAPEKATLDPEEAVHV